MLQRIVMELLTEAGYEAGSEVEIRIDPDARPKPDVIASEGEIEDLTRGAALIDIPER
jgi:hypothetical protein